MQSKEISPAAGIGIGITVLALAGGLIWWRTGSGSGESSRYSEQIRMREMNATDAQLNGERNKRQADPVASKAEREAMMDKVPQMEETR